MLRPGLHQHVVRVAWGCCLSLGALACGYPVLDRLTDAGGGSLDAGSGSSATDDASLCFGSRPQVCLTAKPTGTLTLSNDAAIDTGTDTSTASEWGCQPEIARFCVVAAEKITVAGTLRAYGTKPLVLLASSEIDIGVDGVIDVSSTSLQGVMGVGAGASSAPESCRVAEPERTIGGPGGSFGGRGGEGRHKDDAHGSGPVAAADPLQGVPELRGGCPGGNGGNPNGIPDVGLGGYGGGAVALIAATLSIAGTINASGAGGAGGDAVGWLPGDSGIGGGGGGSGGMISLQAASSLAMEKRARLFANGGGGACGVGNDSGGGDGWVSTGPGFELRGTGGQRESNNNPESGRGGDGSSGMTLDGSASPDQSVTEEGPGGGGGGGGGAGIVYAPGLAAAANISPPPRE